MVNIEDEAPRRNINSIIDVRGGDSAGGDSSG